MLFTCSINEIRCALVVLIINEILSRIIMLLQKIICMNFISCCLSKVSGQFQDPNLNVYNVLNPSIRSVLSETLRRMDELEQQRDADRRMITDLGRRVADLETRHAQRLAEMTSNIDELTTENQRLHEKVGVLHNVLPGTQWSESTDNNNTTENSRKRELIITAKRLDHEISNIGVELRESQKDAPIKAVAFYAILAHENHDISQDSTIVFENIVINVGGHYSQFTGMFTSPLAGLYVFHWNVKSDFNSWVISELVRNGSALGTDLSTYPNSGSATAIAVLEIGDCVWVRITSNTAGAEVQPTFTTFSGFLLQPT
ncbi:uncharacterized protein LOC110466611 [Mizuhopecten yessoensis]|uniref:uncharacterized protein LOC110466611 n=1 Tax=Mizuhopecten yessoensis TaxID=6573 RepID=UPI000B459AF2|nr:uncharacterized protein LOC110466611 [Mizuhopecten yessoensis]